MAAFRNHFIPYEMKTNIIHVTEYREKNIKGILVNPFFPEPQWFNNLTQCLFLMELVMDSLKFPQRSMENRLFNHGEQALSWQKSATKEQQKLPVLASFQVSVLFRQNASWQGNLLWQEKKMEAPFRSALEFIGLMDNALSTWE